MRIYDAGEAGMLFEMPQSSQAYRTVVTSGEMPPLMDQSLTGIKVRHPFEVPTFAGWGTRERYARRRGMKRAAFGGFTGDGVQEATVEFDCFVGSVDGSGKIVTGRCRQDMTATRLIDMLLAKVDAGNLVYATVLMPGESGASWESQPIAGSIRESSLVSLFAPQIATVRAEREKFRLAVTSPEPTPPKSKTWLAVAALAVGIIILPKVL